MDLLVKIRELLGGNKTQKRKFLDSDEYESDSVELKKHRSSIQSDSLKNRFGIESASMITQNTNRERNIDDGRRFSITSLIEGKSQDFKHPMANGRRKVPDLIDVRQSSNEVAYNSSLNGPHQTVKPLFDQFGQSEHEQFRNIPKLCSIKSSITTNPNRTYRNSIFNDSNRMLASSHTLASNNNTYNSSSQIKNVWSNGHYQNNGELASFRTPLNATSNYKRNVANLPSASTSFSQVGRPKTDMGHSQYRALLSKIVPGYNFFHKSKKDSSNETNIVVVGDGTDLRNDDTFASTSSKNTSSIESVNSLRTRMETNPLFRTNWEKDLNDKYSELSLSRKEKIKAEEEISTTAERKTREIENLYNESLRKLSIGSSYPYEIEEEEEPANDYPPLDIEKQKQIVRWISGRDTGTVIISKFRLSISRHDIQTLNWSPLTWLNDEVINFYMELLSERSRNNENLPKVYAMNTFFLPRLLEHSYSGVKRWTRKVDIFSYDVIPVPVHKGIHWCMAIIHLKNKTIKYYDSMGAPNKQAIDALAGYLNSESEDKKKVKFDLSDWKFENVRNIPQQENGSDCGVFSCMYAEFITRNRPIIFSQQHMQYFRMKMIYEICTGQMLN